MKLTIKTLTIFAFVMLFFSCNKKESITPQIIPLPQNLEQTKGTFEITNKTQIVVSCQDFF